MKEVGIDITSHRSKHVDEVAVQEFDYVLTVCDNAKESSGFLRQGHAAASQINDPAAVGGSEEKRLAEFRRVRDELRSYLATSAPDTPPGPIRVAKSEGRRRLK
jgi:arsenate reductase